MKKILWLLYLSLFVSLSAGAQLDATCYTANLEKGKQAYESGDYAAAINSFIYARWCPKSESNGEVDRLISTTLRTWVELLEVARAEEEAQRELADSLYALTLIEKENVEIERDNAEARKAEAQFNARLFYGYHVANEAEQNLAAGALRVGLAKAFHAYDTLRRTGTPVPPGVYRAFGNAVFRNYKTKLNYTHQDGVMDLAASADGRYFLAFGRNQALTVWEYSGGRLNFVSLLPTGVDPFKGSPGGYLLSAAFNPAGDQVAYACRNNFAEFTGLGGSTPVGLRGRHQGAVVQARWLPDGRLLTASRDGKVILWSDRGEFVQELISDEAPFVDLTLSQDGRFALARTMKSVYYWSTDQPGPVAPLLKTDAALVLNAVLSPDGRMVLTSNDTQVQLWEEGRLREDVQAGLDSPALALAFAPDNNGFLVGSRSGLVQIWDRTRGDWQHGLPQLLHNGLVDQLVFHPRAGYFLSTGQDQTIRIVDGGRPVADCREHNGFITSVAFSPVRDSVFLSSSLDGTAKLWLLNGEVIMDMILDSPVSKAVFSRDGAYILSGTESGALYFIPTPEYVYRKIVAGDIADLPEIRKEVQNGIKRLLGTE